MHKPPTIRAKWAFSIKAQHSSAPHRFLRFPFARYQYLNVAPIFLNSCLIEYFPKSSKFHHAFQLSSRRFACSNPNLFPARLILIAGLVIASFTLDVPAHAGIVTLESAANGVYNYVFDVPAGQQVFFNIGDRIIFSDLAGVTGASVSGPDLAGDLTTCGVTATSVCFGAPNPLDLDNITNNTISFGTLTIDSTDTTVGNVFYKLEASPATSGDIGGPVAGIGAIPEPGSFPLLSGGLILLLFGIGRKRIASKLFAHGGQLYNKRAIL